MKPAVNVADVAELQGNRRKLTVVMHADMVGYSRLIGLDDAGTFVRLRALRRNLIDPAIGGNGGTIRQTAGDSFLVVFDSIDGAVQAAIAIQRGMRDFDEGMPRDRRICFRIGINIGDAILDGTDMHGEGVNVAVRLETACPPGGICVSRAVRDHARSQPGIRFEPLGALSLKNIARPVEAFVLHFDTPGRESVIAGAWRTLIRHIPPGWPRRISAALASAIPAMIAVVVGVSISNRYASLPQEQQAALAAQRHADEMARLQALTATQQAMTEALAREKGVPIAALTLILARLGETTISADPSEVESRLERKADEYLALRHQVQQLSGEDPRVTDLRHQAEVALGQADFTLARSKLQEAADVQQAASRILVDRAKGLALAAARSLEESSRVAALTLRYRDAAVDLGKAVAVATPFDQRETWRLTTRQAMMLQSQGEEFGDKAALAESIELYRQALLLVPRAGNPADWARTQESLGISLRLLAEHESEPEHLLEAIAAFRLALEERPRERAPLDWAQTQSNLGYALVLLGIRERGTTRLEEAVAVLRAALEERTRERVPLEWAFTQNRLGVALLNLGEREAGTEHLHEAVSAFRAALQERTRDHSLLFWESIQTNLGLALTQISWRDGGTKRLEEAIVAYRAALEKRKRERLPLAWAYTQNNLGFTLSTLGWHEGGTARLEEAIATYRAALEERTRERAPREWAATQNNLAKALLTLGLRQPGSVGLESLEAAVTAWTACLEVAQTAWPRNQREAIQAHIDQARAEIAQRSAQSSLRP